MKKIILILAIWVMTAAAYSQAVVVSAFNYHREGKLDKAKASIDKAITDPKAVLSAKTWFYRGNIYIDISRSQDSVYKKLDSDALNKAYEAYNKAMELDTKKEYQLDILQRMPLVADGFFNDGASKYNKGMNAFAVNDSSSALIHFNSAVSSFESAFKIYEQSGRVDTTTIFYIATSAELGEDFGKAKQALDKLIIMDYPEPSIYSSMGNICFKQDKDVKKALEYFAIGRKKFPDNLPILLNETNVYLSEGQTEKALENLTLAAKIDESNPTVFFAIGAKYNEIADDTTKTNEVREDSFLKAAVAYKKSVELKPDYFDPNYNMGALYVNKAAAVIEVANKLPLSEQKEFDRLKAEADEYLRNSIPYLEKAHELQPNDRSTLASLKEIYTRLNMLDKLKDVNAKLQE
jgi:Tfp pilus assembly protein PilF